MYHFPFSHTIRVESITKNKMIMTYIIQNRIIRICENEKDYGEYFKELLFPSLRQEHQRAITLIRL